MELTSTFDPKRTYALEREIGIGQRDVTLDGDAKIGFAIPVHVAGDDCVGCTERITQLADARMAEKSQCRSLLEVLDDIAICSTNATLECAEKAEEVTVGASKQQVCACAAS